MTLFPSGPERWEINPKDPSSNILEIVDDGCLARLKALSQRDRGL